MLLSEGIWPCKVLNGTFGEDDKGYPIVQINVQITEGPDVGRRCTYEEQWNARQVPYASRSMKAVGWKGQSVATLKSDIATWVESGDAMSTVEIKHIEIRNGKRAGQIWAKPNAIGRGPRVLKELAKGTLTEADEILKMAMDAPVDDDTPPPPNDNDLPF